MYLDFDIYGQPCRGFIQLYQDILNISLVQKLHEIYFRNIVSSGQIIIFYLSALFSRFC